MMLRCFFFPLEIFYIKNPTFKQNILKKDSTCVGRFVLVTASCWQKCLIYHASITVVAAGKSGSYIQLVQLIIWYWREFSGLVTISGSSYSALPGGLEEDLRPSRMSLKFIFQVGWLARYKRKVTTGPVSA